MMRQFRAACQHVGYFRVRTQHVGQLPAPPSCNHAPLPPFGRRSGSGVAGVSRLVGRQLGGLGRKRQVESRKRIRADGTDRFGVSGTALFFVFRGLRIALRGESLLQRCERIRGRRVPPTLRPPRPRTPGPGPRTDPRPPHPYARRWRKPARRVGWPPRPRTPGPGPRTDPRPPANARSSASKAVPARTASTAAAPAGLSGDQTPAASSGVRTPASNAPAPARPPSALVGRPAAIESSACPWTDPPPPQSRPPSASRRRR